MKVRVLLFSLFTVLLLSKTTTLVLAEESNIVSDSTQQFSSLFTSKDYWTEERMQNAIPLDNIEYDGSSYDINDVDPINEDFSGKKTEIDPVLPVKDNGSIAFPSAVVPDTTGKLFFTDLGNGKNYVCSASAVNNPNKNLVTTAGHCIHEGNRGDFYTNIIFVPAYYEGSTPYGIWNVHWKTTFVGWTENGNYDYDQALLTVFPISGRNLVSVVGGNGLSFNYGQAQNGVRITGYPAADPYTGEFPYSCYGDTTKRLLRNDAQMSCGFTEGASGGAWFRKMSSDHLGHIYAVTSRRSDPRGTLYARPFTSDFRNLYDGMEDK